MNINTYIFTFDGDRELVPMCVAALRHSAQALKEGDTVHITVVDDENARAFTDKETALTATGADAYATSAWPRCGNLNKSACIVGMLDMFNTAPETCDWVMQVDSDTLLRSFEHLRNTRADVIGIGSYDIVTDKRHKPFLDFVCGSGMAIRRERIPVMRALLNREDYLARIDAGNGCSDRVISTLARMTGGRLEIHGHENAARVADDVDFYESRLTAEKVSGEHAARALVLHCDHALCGSRESTVPVMRDALKIYFDIEL